MKRKKFVFFAYNPPTSGVYSVNKYLYKSGEDFRSVKRLREYKNCGFEILQLRYEYAYNGEEWETSQANYLWNIALEAGIKKLLVTDLRLDELIAKGKLIGENCLFKSEKELDEKVLEYVSTYKDKKGFYGIQLLDEPKYPVVTAYGEIVRSIKRVLPKCYLLVNLAPICISIDGISDQAEAYEKYASEMLDKTELDHICFDDYPFRREYIMSGWNIRNYQILARLCKERGADLETILQSFSNTTEGKLRHRKITESDMYWQSNVAMGFGARQYAFYTYMPKFNLDFIEGGDGIDGSCFINNDGSRSALFNYTKRIIKEMQAFSKVLLEYNYENSYFVFEKGKTKDDFEQTILTEERGECPFPIKIDKGVALITEQRNGADRLYMIENIGNVKEELFNNAPPMKVETYLPDGEKSFYFRGKKINSLEQNGKCSLELKVGDAIFVEIKK